MSWTTRSAMLVVLVVTCATLQPVIGQVNLLNNPSFEFDIANSWENNGFQMNRETVDVLHGDYSLRVEFRKSHISGPLQLPIPFSKGRHYAFEGYVKMLNDVDGTLWQVVKAVIQVKISATGQRQSYNIAFRSFANSSQGWIHLKGDIEAPSVDFTEPRFAIRGPEQPVDFLVDNLTLYEVEEDPHWRAKADDNIEAHRKADVSLSVNLPTDVPASEVEIQVVLKSHKFAFGSMLRHDEIVKNPETKLMKIAYSLFDWSTVQNYKWKFHKGDPLDYPDLSEALSATHILRSHGLKVRCHSIFWNVMKNIPEEVWNVRAIDLPSTLAKHLNHVMTSARNICDQWDVQNEHIAMHYYEEKTQNPNITKSIFHLAESMNDAGLLFLNEFQSVTSGAQTEQYYDLAAEYLASGIPLQGIGVQGHVKEYVEPDPTSMMRRITRLSELGLPIMMTEFDIGWPDRIERADWLEDSIRAFFGHPSLHGVILWDFFNGTMRHKDHELVTGAGDDLEILESGQRWACLVRKEWNTNQSYDMASTSSPISLRAFLGDYQVVVRRNGAVVQTEDFVLGTGGASWTLNVTSSTSSINETEVFKREDYVPECVSHRGHRSVASGTSSTNTILTCRTVKAPAYSQPGKDNSSYVSCAAGEVMTGCMSLQKSRLWNQNGEKIETNPTDGSVACVAYHLSDSSEGVKAWARCCSLTGLTCDYKTAGPSFPFDGAMAEASCASGEKALGCSSFSSFPELDGVRPNDDLSGCRAQSGAPYSTLGAERSGAFAYSACCRATTALNCFIEMSSPSGLNQGNAATAKCPAGTVLTGCNAFAADGRSAGARVFKDTKCKAFLGDTLSPGSTGVRAYATCCST